VENASMRKHIVSQRLVPLVLVVAITLSGMAWWHHTRTEAAYADAFLLANIAAIDVCGTTLRLLDRGDDANARLLLDLHLRSSLQDSRGLIDKGARVPLQVSHPNLRESLKRLADYARIKKQYDVAEQVERLLVSLGAS
jgi:hypothetical protein